MKKRLCFLILISFATLQNNAQTIIKMNQENGVYTMPCEVNGLRLRFIFDTGASDISISLTEAVFMLKNGYLSEDDILGTSHYSIANGEILEGTILNLKELKIGNLILHNVKASVVHSLDAPLLLGQSALKKLGKIEFDYSNNTLIINNKNTTELYLSKPQNITVAAHKLNYYSFKKLPRFEQYSIIKNSKLALSQYKKHKRFKTAGISITSLGAGIILSGIILDLVQNREELWDEPGYEDYNNTGGYVAAVGAGVTGFGG